VKYIHKAFCGGTIVASLLSVCAWAAGAREDSSKPSLGATTFRSRCIACHGADATGNTKLGKQLKAANLHSRKVQATSADELKQVITNGKGKMPEFGDQLSTAEIEQVVKYVRGLSRAKN
jgi:mono/diheme cytochrome c family protein